MIDRDRVERYCASITAAAPVKIHDTKNEEVKDHEIEITFKIIKYIGHSYLSPEHSSKESTCIPKKKYCRAYYKLAYGLNKNFGSKDQYTFGEGYLLPPQTCHVLYGPYGPTFSNHRDESFITELTFATLGRELNERLLCDDLFEQFIGSNCIIDVRIAYREITGVGPISRIYPDYALCKECNNRNKCTEMSKKRQGMA